MEHTKEPWHLRIMDDSLGGIDSAEDYSVAQTHQRPNDKFHEERKANARRIVACVNALVGVPTEYLEQAISIGITDVSSGNLFTSRLKLQQQRDELLAAARSAILALAAAAEKDAAFQSDYDKLSEAISKATA